MKKILISIAAVIVVALVAAAVSVHIYLTDERIKSLIVPPAEKALGRKVEIGGVSVSLFSGIEVRDLTVAEADDRNVFARIGRLVIKYRLLPLLHKRIEISRVILEGPQVRISRDKTGRFNFASLAVLAAPATPDRGKRPAAGKDTGANAVSLGIEKISVRDGRILIADQTGTIPATEAGFDLDTSLELAAGAPRFRGKARATVKSAYGGVKPEAEIEAEFDQNEARAEVALALEEQKARITLAARNYQKIPALDLILAADRLDLDRLLALAAKLPKAGPASKTKHGPEKEKKASAPAALPPLTGRVRIGRMTYQDLVMTDTAADFHGKGARLFVDSLALATCGGRIAGKAVLTQDDPLAYEGTVKMQEISIAALRKGLRQTGGGLADGRATVDAVFSGRGTAWPRLADHLSAKGTYSLEKARITRNPYTELLAGVLGNPSLAELTASDIKGDYEVKRGRLYLAGAVAAKDIGLAGKGSVGLAGLDLDFRLSASLPQERARRLNPELARALAGEDGKVKLGLTLRGKAGSPKLALDRGQLKKAARKQVKKRAASEAEKLINKQLGDRPEADLVRGAAGSLLKGLFGE